MDYSWYVRLCCSICHRVNGVVIRGYIGEEKMIGCYECGTGTKVALKENTDISVGHLSITLGIYDPTYWY